MATKTRRLSLWQIVIILGDFLLLAILAANGWRMYQAYIKYKNILTGNLLTDRPDEFIDKITAGSVPIWAWAVEVGALVITIVFLVGWVLPKLRNWRLFTWLNAGWLVAWLVYFVFLAVLVMVAVSSLMSFT